MRLSISDIAANPYLVVSSYILAILGIVLAILFYVRSKREKKPTYQIYGNTLVEGADTELSDLKILYKNEPQERVTVTKVAFWNAGRETINSEDIVPDDALRIEVPAEARVLDVQLVQQSEPSNKFTLGEYQSPPNPETPTVIPLTFQYIDHRNAAVVQVVHTGSHKTKIKMQGKIKGAEHIARVSSVTPMGTRHDPLLRTFDRALSSPKIMRRIGSLTYLAIGVLGLSMLWSGLNAWYAWALTGFGFAASIIFFIGMKPKSPIDLYD